MGETLEVVLSQARKQYVRAETMRRPSFIVICPRCGSQGRSWQRSRRPYGDDEVEITTILQCGNTDCKYETEL